MIIIDLINFLACVKRIPLLGVVIGIFTFFFSALFFAFMPSSVIPFTPWSGLFSAMLGVMTVVLNCLEYVETRRMA
jgi:hypothetical protein